ncbi:MAG: hypothetical protein PHE09_17765 [Oscillospiraceae bacterium]|nr:hypothetical protein [Oscillospiraceae bacterium]
MCNITWFIYHDARHGIAKARTSEKARVLFVAAAINELLRSDTPENKVDWYAVTRTLNVHGELVISYQGFKALYDRFERLEDDTYCTIDYEDGQKITCSYREMARLMKLRCTASLRKK